MKVHFHRIWHFSAMERSLPKRTHWDARFIKRNEILGNCDACCFLLEGRFYYTPTSENNGAVRYPTSAPIRTSSQAEHMLFDALSFQIHRSTFHSNDQMCQRTPLKYHMQNCCAVFVNFIQFHHWMNKFAFWYSNTWNHMGHFTDTFLTQGTHSKKTMWKIKCWNLAISLTHQRDF